MTTGRSDCAGPAIERLAATEPALLACMHGTAYRGDGAAALRALAGAQSERVAR